VAESGVTFYGQAYRAVVVHSSSQEQRRQKHLRREWQASSAALEATVRAAAQPEYCCRADAEAAATKVRALQSADHQVEVVVEEHPQYGPGRPSLKQPRVVTALRYSLQVTRPERAEVIARKTQETACVVLLTHVPTTGEMAQRAGDVLQADKEPHGIAQNCGFLNDPLMVNRLFLKKPARIEALGVVCLLALRIWRLMERSRRSHVETTGNAWPGWDKQETTRPTACMMLTKCARVLVLKVGPQRQLAQAFSAVQQPYLAALGVPAACFTGARGG
jgi:transposase